jgi:hypothetical protein
VIAFGHFEATRPIAILLSRAGELEGEQLPDSQRGREIC